ncbi:MAG: hypothetical protein ACLP9L_10250 [Thermoguttaceae bacterium]
MTNNPTTKGENMNEKEYKLEVIDDAKNAEATSVPDSMPGQSGLKRYEISFWREAYRACVWEVTDARHVKGRFDRLVGIVDSIHSYLPLRVDNLTELKDDRSLDEMSWDEYFAMGREVKELHLAWLKKRQSAQQDASSQQTVEIDSCWPSNGTPGQLTRYRIWYWSAELDTLTHEAENAEQVEEWFQATKLECDTDLTTYHLESIEYMEDDEDRMAKEHEKMLAEANEHEAMPARAKESKPLGMEDRSVKPRLTEQELFARLQRMKEAKKKQV